MSEIFKRQDETPSLLTLPQAGSNSVDSTQSEWQPGGADGFLIKPLLEHVGSGVRTWLMKVEPGAFSELHAHAEVEQIYVVEGSFYDQDKTYGAGEYIVRAPGALHTAGSTTGAVVLLFYSPA